MPPRYNATIGHPGISFLLCLLTGTLPSDPKSKNHRHELGEILISLGRSINGAINRPEPSGGATFVMPSCLRIMPGPGCLEIIFYFPSLARNGLKSDIRPFSFFANTRHAKEVTEKKLNGRVA